MLPIVTTHHVTQNVKYIIYYSEVTMKAIKSQLYLKRFVLWELIIGFVKHMTAPMVDIAWKQS